MHAAHLKTQKRVQIGGISEISSKHSGIPLKNGEYRDGSNNCVQIGFVTVN